MTVSSDSSGNPGEAVMISLSLAATGTEHSAVAFLGRCEKWHPSATARSNLPLPLSAVTTLSHCQQ